MPPAVSVVIPTFHRESRLAFAFEALAQQTLPRQRFEVIVVRAERGLDVELAAAPPGLDLRFMASSVASAAAQRNVGWRAAKSPLVAFLDDDCRPEPGWLEQVLADAPGEGEFVQGRTEPDPDEMHLLHGLARTMVVTEPSPWFPTCNIVYPRVLLEDLDGFDERFPGAYGEDTDLALRALEAGARARFDAYARVFHAVHPRSLGAALREARRRDVMPIVVKRHPQARSGLYKGLFFTWRHAYTWLGLLGLAGSAVWQPFGLVTVPYLWRNVDRARLTPRGVLSQAFHLPARIAVDVTEVLVVLRAAIRQRVLVF